MEVEEPSTVNNNHGNKNEQSKSSSKFKTICKPAYVFMFLYFISCIL